MSGSYETETRSLLNDAESQENADDEEGGRDSAWSDHCHALLLLQKEDKGVERALRTVAVLCALFIVAEFVGGVLSDSLAIITDAGHMLSDFLSFIVSLAAIRFARRSPTRRTTFGCARAEVLGALFSIFIIWTLTIVLVVFATQRIQSTKLDIDRDVMLITSLLAIFFNVVMAAALWCLGGVPASPFAHSHGGGASTSSSSNSIAFSRAQVQPSEISMNVNVRAAFVHILGDFVQSIGVLCAALIIKFTGWTMADPLCTYLFSVIVLGTSFPVLRDICRILMEAVPSGVDYDRLHDNLLRLRFPSAEGTTSSLSNGNGNGASPYSEAKVASPIRAVHGLHVWSLNARQLCASVHIVIDKSALSITDRIIRNITRELQQVHGIMHTTIQIEIEYDDEANGYYRTGDGSMIRCAHCQPLV